MHEAHRWHHFLLQDAHAHFGILLFSELVAEIFAHKAHIAVNRLDPRLTATLFRNPLRIRTQIHELAEHITIEVFPAFLRELPHMLRNIDVRGTKLFSLVAIEDIRFRRLHIIIQNEVLLD